ncbi:MAG: family 78 glycoside hydrolase catalytic domain [Mycobacteriales bacterium]
MNLTPYALRCEHRRTPLGIDETRPLFTWKLAADGPGLRQHAFRLRVQEATGGAVRWDSGWVDSDCPAAGIAYQGEDLQAGTRYDWQLEVRDQHGVNAAPERSWFETGLLTPAAWQARWVRRDPRSMPPVDPPSDSELTEGNLWVSPPCQFRREFELADRPASARAYVTARGVYQLRVNGTRVGADELTPGWTDYRHRLQYQTYDITDLLVAGVNVLGAVVCDGWWSGYIGFDPRQRANHYGRYPEFLAQLHIDGPGAGRTVVISDEHWTESPGVIRSADLLAGETHDQRLATPGWDRPGFDDSSWAAALVAGDDVSTLVGQIDDPVRVTEDVRARTVTRTPSGHQLVDFGQNVVGWVRMRLAGLPAGTRVTLRHGETTDDGELYTANLRSAAATDSVVLDGPGAEHFEPAFTTHGFRYVEVRGHPAELSAADLTARVVHSDTPMVGELHCSDPLVEQLISNIRWGQRGNYVSVPTDCPQRDERLGWTADAQIFSPTACYNADLAAFMNRWLLDVVDGQDADGAFPDVAPLLILDREGAPAWGDGGVVIPHHLWRVYGDRRLLERSFPSMRAWVDHVERHNPDLIWRHATGNGYGDWLQVDADTPRDVVAIAYFARSATLVAETAAALGRDDDAARYADLAGTIRAAFAAAFAKPDGAIGGGTQTAQLMSLAWDLIPEQLRPAAFDQLCRDLESRDARLTTGFVGVPLLCPVLTAGGRDDLAFRLLHQEEFPSWGYSIRSGATTIWERWDGWTQERGFQSTEMNSFNHYSLGSVGEWLWRSVAGIDQAPDSVAYRDLLIEPRLGPRLDWVTASFDSARGLVAVDWRRDGTGVGGQVQIPPGRPAELRLPATGVSDITVDGSAVDQHPSVELLSISAGKAHLRIDPGSWAVASTVGTSDD